jgi:hypothetical protein
MELPMKSRAQFLLGEAPRARVTIAKGIDQCEHFVQGSISQCGGGDGPVKGLEADTALFPLGVGPDGRKIGTGRDLPSERRRSVRRRHAARHLSTLWRERVFHAVKQELLDRLKKRPPPIRFVSEQARRRQTVQRRVNL